MLTGQERGLVLLGAGFVVPVLVAAVAFGWHDFMHWVFTSNDGYLGANGVLGYTLHRGLVQTTWFVLANVAIVALCVAAGRGGGGTTPTSGSGSSPG